MLRTWTWAWIVVLAVSASGVQAATEVDRLRDENKKLKDQVAALQRQVDAAKRDSAANDRLEAENKRLADQITALQRQVDTARRDATSDNADDKQLQQDARKARDDAAAAQKQLEDTRRQLEEVRRQIDTLRRTDDQTAALQKQLDETRRQLDAARRGAPAPDTARLLKQREEQIRTLQAQLAARGAAPASTEPELAGHALLERDLREADLVVVGKLNPWPPADASAAVQSSNLLTARRVLKGSLEKAAIPFYGVHPAKAPAGGAEEAFAANADGIWILRRVPGTDLYRARSAQSLRPLAALDTVREILQKDNALAERAVPAEAAPR